MSPGAVAPENASARYRSWLVPLLLGILLVPPSILAHELGHISGYLAFGFDRPALHYASSAFAREPEFWALVREGKLDAAGRIAGVVQAGWSALFGLLISYALVVLGLWGLARSGAAAPFATAASSAMRFPPVLLLFALGRSSHTDEAHVAQALGIPEPVLSALGVIVLLAALVGGAILLVRRGKGRLVMPALAGVVSGTALWMGFLGPLLLP